ncbi:hypothetical protein vseg_011697 [Gypsophila vaccaria]
MVYFQWLVGVFSGRDLILDGAVTLSFGRHYGLIGRNGTVKTTFLRHLALHAIDGIPKNCQILHVEQGVVSDNTSALQCVFNSDVESTQLLDEEVRLLDLQVLFINSRDSTPVASNPCLSLHLLSVPHFSFIQLYIYSFNKGSMSSRKQMAKTMLC